MGCYIFSRATQTPSPSNSRAAIHTLSFSFSSSTQPIVGSRSPTLPFATAVHHCQASPTTSHLLLPVISPPLLSNLSYLLPFKVKPPHSSVVVEAQPSCHVRPPRINPSCRSTFINRESSRAALASPPVHHHLARFLFYRFFPHCRFRGKNEIVSFLAFSTRVKFNCKIKMSD